MRWKTLRARILGIHMAEPARFWHNFLKPYKLIHLHCFSPHGGPLFFLAHQVSPAPSGLATIRIRISMVSQDDHNSHGGTGLNRGVLMRAALNRRSHLLHHDTPVLYMVWYVCTVCTWWSSTHTPHSGWTCGYNRDMVVRQLAITMNNRETQWTHGLTCSYH